MKFQGIHKTVSPYTSMTAHKVMLITPRGIFRTAAFSSVSSIDHITILVLPCSIAYISSPRQKQNSAAKLRILGISTGFGKVLVSISDDLHGFYRSSWLTTSILLTFPGFRWFDGLALNHFDFSQAC